MTAVPKWRRHPLSITVRDRNADTGEMDDILTTTARIWPVTNRLAEDRMAGMTHQQSYRMHTDYAPSIEPGMRVIDENGRVFTVDSVDHPASAAYSTECNLSVQPTQGVS